MHLQGEQNRDHDDDVAAGGDVLFGASASSPLDVDASPTWSTTGKKKVWT